MTKLRSVMAALAASLASMIVFSPLARAITIDWVTVGDPGNAADSTGYGSVANNYQIMKYAFTNAQYAAFLNAIDPQGTNPQAVWNSQMQSSNQGGINQVLGNALGSRYVVKTNFADKPVNFLNAFSAGRVANWLQNGSPVSATTTNSSGTAPQNVGAYALGTATTGTFPAQSGGAIYWIPTENEWYKAAYYKGSGTNAGYWTYPTQSNTMPTQVTANAAGVGSAGSTGNFANYNQGVNWNGSTRGNVSTVGTNGGPSAYGAFDMGGNVLQMNTLTGAASSTIGFRSSSFAGLGTFLSSTSRFTNAATTIDNEIGFRLVAVPEPTQMVFVAGVGAALGIWRMRKLRRNGRGSDATAC